MDFLWTVMFAIIPQLLSVQVIEASPSAREVLNCGANTNNKLRFIHGDALQDNAGCLGPDGSPYPVKQVELLLPKLENLQAQETGSFRQGRNVNLVRHSSKADVAKTRKLLLAMYQKVNHLENNFEHLPSFEETIKRYKREVDESEAKAVPASNATTKASTKMADNATNEIDKKPIKADKKPDKSAEKSDEKSTEKNPENVSLCTSGSPKVPSRVCQSKYNTTAPMYGISLTSGKWVTIVQKFPDLLQQVIYETCEKKECDILQGECKPTYIPYLFLVIPLGPVTLTGQDYVLVESGCSCRPKYTNLPDPDPLSVIKSFS